MNEKSRSVNERGIVFLSVKQVWRVIRKLERSEREDEWASRKFKVMIGGTCQFAS
ncbi:hypothetical protein Syun_023652 [Stephania yunnanensis]|uniref:Uncharacterized protein n=1 Tax=Stephania yunnanensis TaxID=152371 RepID=A0AAP0I3F9_9MAGN